MFGFLMMKWSVGWLVTQCRICEEVVVVHEKERRQGTKNWKCMC